METYHKIMEILRNELKEAIENLAIMVQREFVAIRKDMEENTKLLRSEMEQNAKFLRNEIQENAKLLRGEMEQNTKLLRDEMQENAQILRNEMQALREEMKEDMQALRQELKEDMRAEIRILHDEFIDFRDITKGNFAFMNGILKNHEHRVERIEKKLDIP